MVLPWSDFWEHNYFAQAWPILTPVITNSFVCGGVTGLGIANVLVAVADLSRIFSARSADVPAPPLEPRTDSRIEP
jgi:hypothetical protein